MFQARAWLCPPTPKKLSKEQKDLLERLAKTMDQEPHGGGKGLFEKIKDALG